MLLLGYDIGTSSVKASLVDALTGGIVAQATYPDSEAPILSLQTGWAEQEPQMWWDNLVVATQRVLSSAQCKGSDVSAIGISYQMHGLVCVDKNLRPLRPSIIWCDSRAVPYGEKAYDLLGHEWCLNHLLNAPGNFTAAKLAWVRENEPDVYDNIYKVMLPGDYIAMRLSGGSVATTKSGLSEGIFWDFREGRLSTELLHAMDLDASLIADTVPTFGIQCRVCAQVAEELGLKEGTPIAYRAGDQPNNALSLNVMEPGQVAATGGTSGVVYGVLDHVESDSLSRVNPFAHVNYAVDRPRLGVLLCVNGTGILNAWVRRTLMPQGITYAEMNDLALQAPIGADGVSIIPFGNGAERMLENRNPGCSIHGLNFNVHGHAHLARAAQEGIAFSFAYGMEIMEQMGMDIRHIHAGHANLFLSPLFRQALATTTGATIQLYDTDGAAGAARGAGIGAGIYASADEAFATLQCVGTTEPNPAEAEAYKEAYERWKLIVNQ